VSLSIPLEDVVNADAVAAYEEVQQQKKLKGEDVGAPLCTPGVSESLQPFFVQHNHCHSASDLTVPWWSFLWMWGLQGAALAEEPVRPVIPFDKVLERFLASEVINGFLSPATGARGARCSAPYNPCHPAAYHHSLPWHACTH
jgi:hypothetical protein